VKQKKNGTAKARKRESDEIARLPKWKYLLNSSAPYTQEARRIFRLRVFAQLHRRQYRGRQPVLGQSLVPQKVHNSIKF